MKIKIISRIKITILIKNILVFWLNFFKISPKLNNLVKEVIKNIAWNIIKIVNIIKIIIAKKEKLKLIYIKLVILKYS